jgi:hypothetical protein
MFLKLLILSAILLSFAALGFGIRMIIKAQGRFPETHISKNPEMRKRGITCAQHTDTGCHLTEGYPGCSCMGRMLKTDS